MMRTIRILALLLLISGCATSTSPHGPTFVGRSAAPSSGFEEKTIFQCTASTGYQLVFSKGKFFVSVYQRGGTVWIKPHSPRDTSGSLPTSPVPSSGTAVDGWLRIAGGEQYSFGADPGSTTSEASPPTAMDLEQIAFIDVWCETQGDTLALAH